MRETIAVVGRIEVDDLSEQAKSELLAAFRGWARRLRCPSSSSSPGTRPRQPRQPPRCSSTSRPQTARWFWQAAPRPAAPTSSRPRRTPTGEASRSGSATTAAFRPRIPARISCSSARHCSSGSSCVPVVHPIATDAARGRGCRRLRRRPPGRAARPRPARPRLGRAHGIALPGRSGARRARPARRRSRAGPRAVRRAGDADDPRSRERRARRLPRGRRGEGGGRPARVRRGAVEDDTGEPRSLATRVDDGDPRRGGCVPASVSVLDPSRAASREKSHEGCLPEGDTLRARTVTNCPHGTLASRGRPAAVSSAEPVARRRARAVRAAPGSRRRSRRRRRDRRRRVHGALDRLRADAPRSGPADRGRRGRDRRLRRFGPQRRVRLGRHRRRGARLRAAGRGRRPSCAPSAR